MLEKILIAVVNCYDCSRKFYFVTYNCQQWKYYYQQGKIRPLSDFYQLYCTPPFPNYQDNIFVHCRHCLVYFLHNVVTDQEGKQNNGAIYIDKNGLCIECRNKEEHINHPCLLNKQQRAWGTKKSWEGLFTASSLPAKKDIWWNNKKSKN